MTTQVPRYLRHFLEAVNFELKNMWALFGFLSADRIPV